MKKRHYVPAIYSILIFLAIFSFHTYQNLKAIITPPSEKWAREYYVDKTPYKKPASIGMDKDNILILTAKEDRFTKTILERDKPAVKETLDIIIPDAALNKLVEYKNIEPYIFWTENYELYMSKRQETNNYESKSLVLTEVNDFNVYTYNGEIILAAAYDMGLKYYKIDEKGLTSWGEDYPFEKPVYVSAAIDRDGVYHTVSIRDKSPMEKEIIYLLFSEGKWTLKAQKTEYAQVSNERIGNLEIGLDKNLAYIFYENNVWNTFGQTARTWYTTVPLNEDIGNEISFRLLSSKGAESSEDPYVSELRCPDYMEDELTAVFIEKYYDEADEGFRILNTAFKDGKITNSIASTRCFDWIKGIDIGRYANNEALVFLRSAGEFKNDIWFTQTGEEYNRIIEKPTKNDYIIAVENSIPPYISGLIIALIKAFIFLPAVIWLLFVEFFEIRKFQMNPKLNYSVTISIYMILKLVSANSYYRGLSYFLIPNFMKPDIIKYFIMIMISIISYLVAKAYKKNISDLHIIPEFLLFMLYDLLITVFLYGPYIT